MRQILIALIMLAVMIVPASASAPITSGPTAYYDPSYSRADWEAIYWTQASWGNAVGPPAYEGEYWCAHASYDVVGVRLYVLSGGQQFICVTGDTVQDAHKGAWFAKWGLEASWNLFARLPDPGYVEVYAANPLPAAPPEPEVMTFSETEYVIANGFLAFWVSYGGLPIFGYPLTNEFDCDLETGQRGVCQYFERARFELHPDGAIRLGRLGAEIIGR